MKNKINCTIRKVMESCQHTVANHPNLINELRALYDEINNSHQFFSEFLYYLKFPLSKGEREPAVERTIDFVAKFVCSFINNGIEEGKDSPNTTLDMDDDLHPFVYLIFDWLLEHHEVKNPGVRFRVCQLINKLLKNMNENFSINDDLYVKIYDNMLVRLQDKIPNVRVEAVSALQRLQNPKDKNCPIIKAYLFHMECDASFNVKRMVIASIGASYLTLPHVIDRTKDSHDLVRRQAYKFLAEKVHIKSLTITQRENLLKRGLSDRSESVRRVVEKILIPSWLRLLNGSIIDYLKALDVSSSDEAASDSLQVLFKDIPFKELVTCFKELNLMNENKVISEENLTPETALYWKSLCLFLKGEGNAADELLEEIIPNLTPFCEYIRQFILAGAEVEEENVIAMNFISNQLISMTKLFDLSDEVGRRNLRILLKDLLLSDRVNSSIVCSIIKIYVILEKNVTVRINEMAEAIAEIRQPMKEPEQISFTVEEQAEQRKKEIEIAKVKIQINMLKNDLDEAVQNQDFVTAQSIKNQIEELDTTRTKLQDLLTDAAHMNNSGTEGLENLDNSTEQREDPKILYKCLTIIVEVLQDPHIKSLNNTLQSLLEEFILPCVQKEWPKVRELAIKALGCCCNLGIEVSRQHLLLMLQVAHLDMEDVRIVALSSVFDSLLVHGIHSYSAESSNDEQQSNIESVLDSEVSDKLDGRNLTQSDLNTQGGNSIIAILVKLLDSDNVAVRTIVAEGMCKLLINGHINSPKLLSRLILLWYNPLSERECKMRHILGVFFPFFASLCRANQDSLEEAFLPTMKILFDAPVTSPLADINPEDVGIFFVQLTREDLLRKSNNINNNVHDSLSFKICNEILGTVDNLKTKVLLKLLSSLVFTPNNFENLRDLLAIAMQIKQTVLEKSCIKSIEKFIDRLKTLLEHDTRKTIDQEMTEASKSPVNSPPRDEINSLSKRRILYTHAKKGPELIFDPSTESDSQAEENVSNIVYKKVSCSQSSVNIEEFNETSISTQVECTVNIEVNEHEVNDVIPATEVVPVIDEDTCKEGSSIAINDVEKDQVVSCDFKEPDHEEQLDNVDESNDTFFDNVNCIPETDDEVYSDDSDSDPEVSFKDKSLSFNSSKVGLGDEKDSVDGIESYNTSKKKVKTKLISKKKDSIPKTNSMKENISDKPVRSSPRTSSKSLITTKSTSPVSNQLNRKRLRTNKVLNEKSNNVPTLLRKTLTSKQNLASSKNSRSEKISNKTHLKASPKKRSSPVLSTGSRITRNRFDIKRKSSNSLKQSRSSKSPINKASNNLLTKTGRNSTILRKQNVLVTSGSDTDGTVKKSPRKKSKLSQSSRSSESDGLSDVPQKRNKLSINSRAVSVASKTTVKSLDKVSSPNRKERVLSKSQSVRKTALSNSIQSSRRLSPRSPKVSLRLNPDKWVV